MRIAYFINQYPKVSHSFIRREILALERQGFEVQRVALRGWDAELVDAEDVSERDKTRYVLQDGVKGLLAPALQVLRAQPRRFFSALGLALRMGRRADRSWPYHLVYLLEACRLLSWLQAFGARHVHAHFGTNSTEVVMLASALAGRRTVLPCTARKNSTNRSSSIWARKYGVQRLSRPSALMDAASCFAGWIMHIGQRSKWCIVDWNRRFTMCRRWPCRPRPGWSA
jgi:hypothetical protein